MNDKCEIMRFLKAELQDLSKRSVGLFAKKRFNHEQP